MFVCSDCTYPSRLADRCDNPGCLANPSANHASLIAMRDKAEAERREWVARKAARESLKRSGFTPAY